MLPLLVLAAHAVAAWFWTHRSAKRGSAGGACDASIAMGSRDSAAAAATAASGSASLLAAATAAATSATTAITQPPDIAWEAAIEALESTLPPLQLPPRPQCCPALPLGTGKQVYSFVATVPLLAAAAMELFEQDLQDRIALDVEHHSQHSFAGVTCLIQLSTGTKDFLIDSLALPAADVRRLLGPVLSSPRICKVVHGGGNDVAWLQRDFGLLLLNVFDTEKACQVLGFQQRNLGLLLQRYCGVTTTIDKRLGQLADWRQRPLPAELVEYARRDVHHLLDLADILGEMLLDGTKPAAGRLGPAPQHGEQHQQTVGGQQAQGQEGVAAEPAEAAGDGAGSSPRQALWVPPPSIVQQSPACQQALEAAMAEPHSKLHRAVHRSQALSRSRYQPTPPAAVVAAAAIGLMKQHVAAATQRHPRLTSEQVQHLETVADCVHTLAGWRDAAARAADEGLQCMLPDAVLLRLAEAAAASVTPQDSNLRGRCQGLIEEQVLSLLPLEAEGRGEQPVQDEQLGPSNGSGRAVAAATASSGSSCGCFPAVVRQQATQVAAMLSEAAAGQRPWTCAELNELLAQAGGGQGAQPGAAGSGSKALKRHDPVAFRQRLADKFGCKKLVYESARMYSLEGELLCHTDRRKLEWYLSKRLADKISDDPLCVRLTFQHKTGDQQQGTSAFYTVEKRNCCVACGEESHFLRYRIVPHCYRKAMPVALKSHRSHDVVLLCVPCHELAQTAAEKLKRQIAKEHKVPLLPPLPKQPKQQQDSSEQAEQGAQEAAVTDAAAGQLALHPYNVRRSALALQRYSEQMPDAKRRQLESQVRRFLGTAGTADAIGGQSGLTPEELCGGLLAGLGRKTRRRTLKRWVRQGRQLPAELAAEVAEAAPGEGGRAAAAEEEEEEEGGDGGEGSSDQADEEGKAATGTAEAEPGRRANGAAQASHSLASAGSLGLGELRNTGHAWHGQQVVERLAAQRGEDGLLDLCRRFRQCFVDALQPQFLPVGWDAFHFAKRQFGEHSIYARENAK